MTFAQLTQKDGSFIVSREKNDNFTLMIKKADVNLIGISDLYGFEQGSKILSSDCKRNIICDGVPPVVMSMTPNNGEKSDNNVYQNALLDFPTFFHFPV